MTLVLKQTLEKCSFDVAFALFLLVGSSNRALSARYDAFSKTSSDVSPANPNNIADLVIPFGYPLEEHVLITQDGYVLTLYRIPASPTSGTYDPASTKRPAVLLNHGLLDSCACFLLLGPGRALAFLLADQGFDVWLGNARGSTHSRSHTRLNTSSSLYWAFSFDEMAKYDLPAQLDKISEVTGHAQVSFVGHSQGTTVLLAALASQPALNHRIKMAVLLAPVVFTQKISSIPFLTLASLGTDQIFTMMGVNEFLPSDRVVALLEGGLCSMQPALCLNILSAIAGFSQDNVDPDRLPSYLKYTPAGTSVQNIAHWSQAVRQDLPRTLYSFDYGSDCTVMRGGVTLCNWVRYGRPDPPTYNLGAVRSPVMLVTGGKDRLSDAVEVEYLREVLPTGVVVEELHVARYEHLDFTWGRDVADVVYRHIVETLLQCYR
jgi:pimeloyl-ACP methyl ester carboxylesterase